MSAINSAESMEMDSGQPVVGNKGAKSSTSRSKQKSNNNAATPKAKAAKKDSAEPRPKRAPAKKRSQTAANKAKNTKKNEGTKDDAEEEEEDESGIVLKGVLWQQMAGDPPSKQSSSSKLPKDGTNDVGLLLLSVRWRGCVYAGTLLNLNSSKWTKPESFQKVADRTKLSRGGAKSGAGCSSSGIGEPAFDSGCPVALKILMAKNGLIGGDEDDNKESAIIDHSSPIPKQPTGCSTKKYVATNYSGYRPYQSATSEINVPPNLSMGEMDLGVSATENRAFHQWMNSGNQTVPSTVPSEPQRAYAYGYHITKRGTLDDLAAAAFSLKAAEVAKQLVSRNVGMYCPQNQHPYGMTTAQGDQMVHNAVSFCSQSSLPCTATETTNAYMGHYSVNGFQTPQLGNMPPMQQQQQMSSVAMDLRLQSSACNLYGNYNDGNTENNYVMQNLSNDYQMPAAAPPPPLSVNTNIPAIENILQATMDFPNAYAAPGSSVMNDQQNFNGNDLADQCTSSFSNYLRQMLPTSTSNVTLSKSEIDLLKRSEDTGYPMVMHSSGVSLNHAYRN